MIANRVRMRKKPKGDTWDVIFADPEVGRVLHANGLIANANKSSIEELATITSLNPSNEYNGSYFCSNKVITQFPELQYCTGLTSLYYAFRDCSNLTTVVIPSSVTILDNTFNKCSSLTTAPVIPESVTILDNTFSDCTRLTKAPIIPSSVTDLVWTFYYCIRLTTAPVIPESVTNMNSTFYKCSKLTTAPAIPSRVTDLRGTFYACTAIDGIYIINAVTPPTYNSDTLSNVQAIYVPDDSVDRYKKASGWTYHSSKMRPMSQYPK